MASLSQLIALGGGSDADVAGFAEAIARLRADRLRLTRGVADGFADQDGVDLATSTNEDWIQTSTKGYRGRSGSTPTNIPPDMTSNTFPTPYVASATGALDPTQAFKAFDDTTSGGFVGDAAGGTMTATIDLGVERTVDAFSLGINARTSIAVAGSTDGSSFTTLYSAGSSGSPLTLTDQAISGTYRYMRVTLVAAGGAFGIIAHFKVRTPMPVTPDALSLRSIAYTALLSPATGHIRVKATTATGTITPGTNLRAYATRNDGATWDEAALTYLGEFEGGRNYEGDIAFTGAAGTAMRWRVDTTTGGSADITVDDVVLLWTA